MASPLSVMVDIVRAARENGLLTIFHPTSAGLLGGQGNLTAHSSLSQPESSAGWVSLQQAAEAQMQQAQQMQQATVCYSTSAMTFVSTGPGIGLATMAHPPAATKKSTEAIARSMELLYDWLSPEQRKQLAICGYFDVVGGDTGIRYRLYPPANYNIHQLVPDSNETEVKLCFEPKDKSLPKGDIWLCQKLALELDERATLEIANRSASYYG